MNQQQNTYFIDQAPSPEVFQNQVISEFESFFSPLILPLAGALVVGIFIRKL